MANDEVPSTQKPAGTQWRTFWGRWPNSDVDHKGRAKLAFDALDDEDQRRAIEAIPAYFDAVGKKKGATPLKASSYLAQKKWRDLDHATHSAKTTKTLGPWTKAWVALLVHSLNSGDARGASSMVRFAERGVGRSVHPNRPHTADLLKKAEAYRLVPAHHQDWITFVGWVARRSRELRFGVIVPDLPSSGDNPFFVAVPPADVELLGGEPATPPSRPPTHDEIADAFK